MQSAKNASPQDAVETLKEILAKFTPGAPIAHEHLVMVPLYDNAAADLPRDYLTLGEALDAGTAKLREVSEGGSVSEVLFDNKGDKPVLLVEGDELTGAKQNRTINITVFAPAKQKTIIPVSCVERDRWGYRSADFRTHDDAYQFGEGRRSKIDAVSRNIRERGSRDSDQGEVWRGNDAKFARMGVSSHTSDAAELRLQSHAKLSGYKSAVKAQPKQVGGVFFAGNDIGGVDLFAHGDVFAHMFPKLLTSYAIDAVDAVNRSGATDASANAGQPPVEAFLDAVRTAPGEVYEAPGLGNDVRINSAQITGAALLHDKRVLHLAAFRRDEVGGGRNVNRRAKARARRNQG